MYIFVDLRILGDILEYVEMHQMKEQRLTQNNAMMCKSLLANIFLFCSGKIRLA